MSAGEISMTALSANKTAPRWSFTNQPKPKERGRETPGPGAYASLASDKDKFRTMPRFSIGGSSREGKDGVGPPGPGQHTPNDKHMTANPLFSFGSEPRLHEARRSRTPGPDSYNVSKGLGGNSYSVAGRPEGRSKSLTTPSPNKYLPDMSPCWKSAPKSSFGASNNKDLVLSKNPGPGSYEIASCFQGRCDKRSPPSYTIMGKRSAPKPIPTPGPISSLSQFK